jgi:hypothetical protein
VGCSKTHAPALHPSTEQGYGYMANVWYEAIKGYLPN